MLSDPDPVESSSKVPIDIVFPLPVAAEITEPEPLRSRLCPLTPVVTVKLAFGTVVRPS